MKIDLESLLEDYKEIERLSNLGKEYAKHNHAVDNVVKILDEIYSIPTLYNRRISS